MAEKIYYAPGQFKNEAQLNRVVKDYLNAFYPNCFVYKRTPGINNVGMPDLTGAVMRGKKKGAGQRIELEGKMPGNGPSKMQEYYLKRFGEIGCIVGVYECVEDMQIIMFRYGFAPKFCNAENVQNYNTRTKHFRKDGVFQWDSLYVPNAR